MVYKTKSLLSCQRFKEVNLSKGKPVKAKEANGSMPLSDYEVKARITKRRIKRANKGCHVLYEIKSFIGVQYWYPYEFKGG